jgi:hypothetical protein
MARQLEIQSNGEAVVSATSAGKGGVVKDQYTTTEQFTGKYWIDGKPIYRRVFDGTYWGNLNGLAAGASVNENLNTLIPNINKVITNNLLISVTEMSDPGPIGAPTTSLGGIANLVLTTWNQVGASAYVLIKNNTSIDFDATQVVTVSGWIEYTRM